MGDAALGRESWPGVVGVGGPVAAGLGDVDEAGAEGQGGWPVWLEMVSISSRSEGTIRRSTVSKRRASRP